MLIKLIKYDVRCTARKFVPVIISYLLVSVLIKFFYFSEFMDNGFAETQSMEVLAGLLFTTYMILTYVMIFFAFFNNMSRFNKNLFSDEGYLMHTLPVKPSQHIISKLVSAVIWNIISVVSIMCSVLILAAGKTFLKNFVRILNLFAEGLVRMFKQDALTATLAILLTIVIAVFTYMLLYFSSALGHLFSTKSRIATIVIFYFLLSFVGINLMISSINIFESLIKAFNITTARGENILILSTLNIFFGALAVALFAGTAHIIGKKLNLE